MADEKLTAEAKARAELNAEQERVMAESKPTPTQAENDAAKLGTLNIDEKEDPKNPDMPSLAEQQQKVASAAGNDATYQTRSAAADAARGTAESATNNDAARRGPGRPRSNA